MKNILLKLSLATLLLWVSLSKLVNAWQHFPESSIVGKSVPYMMGYTVGKFLSEFCLLFIAITLIYQAIQLIRNPKLG